MAFVLIGLIGFLIAFFAWPGEKTYAIEDVQFTATNQLESWFPRYFMVDVVAVSPFLVRAEFRNLHASRTEYYIWLGKPVLIHTSVARMIGKSHESDALHVK